MIFYFSGTGNSAWAARQLAHLTGDEVYDITTFTTPPDVQNVEQIGFVFPIYAWGAPEPMMMFARKLKKSGAFTFGVCTCGGEAGLAMKIFSESYPLDSSYSLVMPNNYIVGMDAEPDVEIENKITAARKEIQNISQEILRREKRYRVKEGRLAGVKSRIANLGFNKFARSAKPFFVQEQCDGCGLCVSHCPASAISLRDGKPLWNARCYQCMCCINLCPQQAIQYGKSTAGRRRYMLSDYLPPDERA